MAYTEEPEPERELIFRRDENGGSDEDSWVGTSWNLVGLGISGYLDTPISGVGARFLDLLGKVETYEIVGNTLTLTIPRRFQDYVIRPSSEEHELMLIRARIGNYDGSLVLLDIEGEPPQLSTNTGTHDSVNSYTEASPTDNYHAQRNEFLPFVRGTQRLDVGFELHGWLVFDVPKGSEIESFKWVAGEEIIVDMTDLRNSTPTPSGG